MGTIWQDLRYGARLLLKKPGFTIAALARLTLGIGASTIILCRIDAVLLAPLPFPEPDRLLKLEERHPGVSLAKIRTMEQVLASSVTQRRFSIVPASVFASISLALAALGIAGVMAFATEQRTQENGIRRALGARTVDIVQMILSLGFQLIFLGIAIGLGAALVSSRLLTHLLFGVSASDPFTYFAAATVVALAAAIACYLPACSAARVDPMVVLRYE